MIFEPRVIFCILWISQIAGYMLFGGDFTPFDLLTWGAVEVAAVSFLTGATLTSYVPVPRSHTASTPHRLAQTIRPFAYLVLALYLCGCAFSLMKLYTLLTAETGGALTGPAIRQAVISDFLGERQILQTLRIFYFGVGLCVYLLAFSSRLSKVELAVVLIVGLVSAIATTGRLYILLFFISSTALLYRQKVITLRMVASGALGFVVLFFVVAVVMGKEGSEDQAVLEQIGWNAKVYILSSLACFNNFVHTGDQHVVDGMLLPNFVREWSNNVFGTELSFKPDLNPFAEVPLQCNTYTALFQLFHDGGLLGLSIGMALVGAVQRWLYRWHVVSQSPVVWYAFALSLYPLAMTIFEDAYFSSLGFWVMLWFPPLMHYILAGLLPARASIDNRLAAHTE